LTIQHHSYNSWEETRRRIPWIQICVWIFLVGVAWAKLNSLEDAHREVESTYVRKDVLGVEMRALGEKIDMQTDRIRLLENQIGRLRAELNSIER